MELSDDIYEQVLELCDDGDFLIEQEEYNQAINKYKAALELMPDSKYEWEASTWIYVAMGDAYYYGENYEEALNSLIEGTKCPDGFGNAFILLRMGQCYYMLDDISKAKEYLLEAYMLQGEVIFEDESEEFFELIKYIIEGEE